MIRAIEIDIDLINVDALKIIEYSRVLAMVLSQEKFKHLDINWLTPSQLEALNYLKGHSFMHIWQLEEELAQFSKEWKQGTCGFEKNFITVKSNKTDRCPSIIF